MIEIAIYNAIVLIAIGLMFMLAGLGGAAFIWVIFKVIDD